MVMINKSHAPFGWFSHFLINYYAMNNHFLMQNDNSLQIHSIVVNQITVLTKKKQKAKY
jgi:hypothetical protein